MGLLEYLFLNLIFFLFQRQYSIEISIALTFSPRFTATHAVPCSSEYFESIRKNICSTTTFTPLSIYTHARVRYAELCDIYKDIYKDYQR